MIEPTVHLCWIGRRLPWPIAYAARSAARNAQLERVIFHHTDPIEDEEPRALLESTPSVELRRLVPHELLAAIPELGPALVELYDRIGSPVARSNILRAALLYQQGGVYLDTDTITVRSLRPLLDSPAFLGLEHIVRPSFVHASRSRWLRLRASALSTLRGLLKRVPRGYRVFRALSHWYYEALNGAVFGARAGHPLLYRYLRAMVELPRELQSRKHGLGTHLLQSTVAADSSDLVVHPPSRFYPLGPEISEHWFRRYRKVDPSDTVAPSTCVVHWYGSVGTRDLEALLTPEFVRRESGSRMYCALVAPLLPPATTAELLTRPRLGAASGWRRVAGPADAEGVTPHPKQANQQQPNRREPAAAL